MLWGEMITQVICGITLAWGPLGVDWAQTKGHLAQRKWTGTSENMANNPQSTNKACFQDLSMRTFGFTHHIDVCQLVKEKEQGASNGRQGPKSASFS